MNAVTASRADLRLSLRRRGDALPHASIGTVPMLWINAGNLRRLGEASTTARPEDRR